MEPYDTQLEEKRRLLARLKAQGVNLDTMEKRKLDEHTEARLLDNGMLIIFSDWNGIQLVLSAEKAMNLLDLLTAHKEVLFRFSQERDEPAGTTGNEEEK
jgi:hypothetical protein